MSGVGDKGLASSSAASPAEVAALYDTWANTDYDRDLESWGYVAPERVAARVADHLSVADTVDRTGIAVSAGSDGFDVEVLDAGCGTGRVGAALRALGIDRVIGGDFSTASIEVARSRAVYDDVLHLDLNAPLPFADDRFAAAVSVGVFSYLTDSAATIRELLRVVAPGGLVLFTQRSDLWGERDFDRLIRSLVTTGLCAAAVAEPVPYLPGHPEFGTDIGVIDTTLIKLGAVPEP
jgi:SAM-dependent methyltransferase